MRAFGNKRRIIRGCENPDSTKASFPFGAVHAEIEAGLRRADSCDDDDERARLLEPTWSLVDALSSAAPTTAAEATAKLRLMLHPEIGMPTSDHPRHISSLNQVLEFLERTSRGDVMTIPATTAYLSEEVRHAADRFTDAIVRAIPNYDVERSFLANGESFDFMAAETALAEFRADPSNDECDDGTELYRHVDRINSAIPRSMADVAIKFRLLLDENVGIPASENLSDSEEISLKQISAFVEEEARAQAVVAARYPDDVAGIFFSQVADHTKMPLSFMFKDGSSRTASEAELARHLRYRPWDVDEVAPSVLRRIFPREDGEFFALLAEKRALVQRGDVSGAYAPEAIEELAANFRAICDTPVVTDAAVAMKLSLLMRATWQRAWHGPQLTVEQQRQVLWSAIAWLQQPFKDRNAAFEVRPVDTKKVANDLASYIGEPETVA